MSPVSSLRLAVVAASFVSLGSALAQDTVTVPTPPPRAAYTAEQLDNLVAAIALYPDPILAQLLVAATFPEQISFAAAFVRANGTRDIDEREWDISVKSIAHYPPVLNLLADKPDWATALGQAYAAQSTDVMEAVQRLRTMARAQGNLESTPEQRVVVADEGVSIVPAQPTVIYVPTYDPTVVFYRPARIVGAYAGFWSFGVGFPIGAWLSYDCDWYRRRVFYDGWHGGGWRIASRPFIRISHVYVHPRFRVVAINRDVLFRDVDYWRLRRDNRVHRAETFANRDRGVRRTPQGGRDDPRGGSARGREQNDSRPLTVNSLRQQRPPENRASKRVDDQNQISGLRSQADVGGTRSASAGRPSNKEYITPPQRAQRSPASARPAQTIQSVRPRPGGGQTKPGTVSPQSIQGSRQPSQGSRPPKGSKDPARQD